MSCVPSDPRFRLLDHLVGWDEDDFTGLTGLYDGGGLRLEGSTDGITVSDLDPFIPPPRLAPGCDPCDWYLATKPAPQSRVLALDGCDNRWSPLRGCFPVELDNAVAIAVDRDMMALADAGAGKVWLLHLGGWQVAGEVDVTDPIDLAFGPELLAIAHKGGTELLFATRSGRIAGTWPGALPPGPLVRIAYDRNGLLWLVVRKDAERFLLYRQEATASAAFVPATAQDLAAAFDRRATVRSSAAGFCLLRGGASGTLEPFCYDWFSRPLDGCAIGSATASGGYATQGQLLTGAIDSGEPRCLWHRIRIDADVPPNTAIAVAVATSEEASPAAQGLAPADWAGFPAGVPHPGDWQELGGMLTDALVRQPAGRYLFVRIRLTGDGSATPRVHRVRLDFPRGTSADLLPAVYREEAEAGDFTERFVALFDATLEGVETAVARFPALLDTRRVPADALPWIARFLGVTLDESWNAETRRRVLAGAPALFRKRGTPGGLRSAIELVYGEGTPAVITEHGTERQWGAVAGGNGAPQADARLGSVRLFSRKSSRMTLGVSPIGSTRVMSFGNPATDPHATGAFRFTVTVPPQAGGDARALLRLVEGQKPGHTIAHIREGGSTGFLLGKGLMLGIDTVIRRPAPQALGDPELRLGRGSVLGGAPKPRPVLGHAPLTSPSPRCTE